MEVDVSEKDKKHEEKRSSQSSEKDVEGVYDLENSNTKIFSGRSNLDQIGENSKQCLLPRGTI